MKNLSITPDLQEVLDGLERNEAGSFEYAYMRAIAEIELESMVENEYSGIKIGFRVEVDGEDTLITTASFTPAGAVDVLFAVYKIHGHAEILSKAVTV